MCDIWHEKSDTDDDGDDDDSSMWQGYMWRAYGLIRWIGNQITVLLCTQYLMSDYILSYQCIKITFN